MSKKRKLFSGIAILLVIALMISLFPLGVFADGATVTDAVYGDSSVTDSVYSNLTVTNAVYSDPSHFSYEISGSDAIITGYTGPGGNIVIPDSIEGYSVVGIKGSYRGTSYKPGAFENNPNIVSVVIPDGVTFIGENAFSGSVNLTSVTLPSTLNNIADGVFANTSLTSIVIPSNVTRIGMSAFKGTKLESVVIPPTVTEIGIGAFEHCYNLKSIIIENPNTIVSSFIGTIPQQTTIVGHVGSSAEEYAIANNINFKDITTGTDVPEIDNGGQDPISRYHRGEDVAIKDLFEDEDLATYFAEWVSYEFGQQWSVTDLINKVDVETRIMDLYIDSGFSYVSFGDPASNMGVSSLEGMQIFDKGLFKNPRIAKNIYFPNSSLTDVDPLSFLEDAKNIFLNDGQLTNVDGLINLRTVDTLDLGRNKLTDISGLTSLTSIDTLRLNDNQLTNNDMATLTSVFNSANPNYVDAAYNYFVLGDAESTQFFNNLMEITSYVGARSPQYNFEFVPIGSVKVEYRDRDTNEIIDSEVFTNVDILKPQTYYAKDIDGYSLDDDFEKTVSGFDATESAVLTPKFLLRGIYAPNPNTSVDGLVDWNSVTYTIKDNSVLKYDAVSTNIEVIGSGNTEIDVFEKGEYRGTYSVDTGAFGSNPVVFYYKKLPPSHYTVTVQVEGQGTTNPSAGTYQYPAGEWVNLIAISAEDGYVFEKWVINGKEYFFKTPGFTLDEDIVAIAYFKPTASEQYTLTVNQIGDGNVSPAGVSKFYEFETVELTANPADGYKFVKWVVNGQDVLNANFTLTMVEDATAIAHFEPLPPKEPRLFTLTVNQVGEGTITPSSSDGKLVYKENEKVVLNAEPADGYQFVKWVVDGQEYTDAEITIKMDKDKTATAYFEKVTPPPVIKGKITVEFRDAVTNEKIKEDEVLTDLDLGEHSYIAETQIGVYELVGEALKKVVLTVAEPIQKITYFYKEKVITPPADDDPVEPPVDDDDPVEPPVVQEPPTPPVVEEPAEPPVVDVPAEPPVVEQPEEPISNEKPVVEDPIADEPVENEPVIVQEPVSDEGSSEDVPVSNDVSIVEKAPELDQVRIVAIDVETDEVLTEEILRDLPLGKQVISAPAIEGYEPLAPIIQSVTVAAQGRQLVVEFRYQKLKQFGTVFGVVTDVRGNPIKGIQVELHSNPRVTYTDQNGEYRFEEVEFGQHTIILKNPLTKEELGKVDIVVYQDGQQTSSKTESLQDTNEVKTVIELNESQRVKRIDFIIESVESADLIPQIPQEPEPIEPQRKLPFIPIAVTSLPFIVAVVVYFRRKNVVVTNEDGLIIKKLRLKAKPETVIDLTSLEASTFIIQFKNPDPFRNVELFVKHGDDLTPVKLQDGQSHIEFEL
ncbi:leucine-rich repeat protein [Paenibacillus sp. FSL R5-0527]|uniref:InlB B-repeat-containing protein n=1 Tax=Paenibacillus sp. FSL R5-0527 TaxID=2975321 RepID=UPI00097A294B|nr:hypothetical protein BK140_10415 [Paenibacillus macerans]